MQRPFLVVVVVDDDDDDDNDDDDDDLYSAVSTKYPTALYNV